MFAILLWQMRPITLNGKLIDAEIEVKLFGRSFERQGQDQRIKLLVAIGAASESDARRLDDLRTRRRKHFHLWSNDSGDPKADAFHCFWLVVQVAESVLQVEFANGKLIINPALRAYVDRHNRERTGSSRNKA